MTLTRALAFGLLFAATAALPRPALANLLPKAAIGAEARGRSWKAWVKRGKSSGLR